MTPEDELEAIMKALPEKQRKELEDLLNTLTGDDQAHIWRLAQARALLRELGAVSRMPAGSIKPSDEDVAAATREYIQEKKKPQDN